MWQALYSKVWHDEKGATMIEYSIMVVVVALAIVLMVPDLRTLIADIFSIVGSGMDSSLQTNS
jgi:Flp pilus assembly pilin Flp